jgi:AAA domain
MNMLAGDPGLGKSTIIVDLVALHSIGGDFPMGEGAAIVCDTVYLTAEDGLADTLVPRLIAADANLKRIHFLTGTRIEGTADSDAMFDIQRDVAALRDVFTANSEIRILVIDPVTAYLGAGAKAKENTEVRRVLTPLVKLAEEFGVMVIANNHLNKSGGKALYRVLDSIAFTALGRTIHVVAEDGDNRDLKKFICSKTNIGSLPRGLTYIIQKVWIPGEHGEEIETTRIAWGTQYIDDTADEALSANTDGKDEGTITEDAVEFLRTILAKGRVRIQDIEAEAKEARLLGNDQEISLSKPFRNARKTLKVVFSRDGFGPGATCYWALPAEHPPEDPTIVAPILATEPTAKTEGNYGDEGNYGETEEGKGSSLVVHTCPPHHTCPQNGSREKGNYEGNYAPPAGVMAANGYAVAHSPDDRRPLEPAQLTAKVWISEIRHPAISAGPDDNLDDFAAF